MQDACQRFGRMTRDRGESADVAVKEGLHCAVEEGLGSNTHDAAVDKVSADDGFNEIAQGLKVQAASVKTREGL